MAASEIVGTLGYGRVIKGFRLGVAAKVLFTAETAEGAEMNGVNELTNEIIGAAIEVHRTLGPGLLESTYEGCLLHVSQNLHYPPTL